MMGSEAVVRDIPTQVGVASKPTANLRQTCNILRELSVAVEKGSWSQKSYLSLLTRLKELSRIQECADTLCNRQSIHTIATFGLDPNLGDASREGLKCLANAMFLQSKNRQIFVDLGLVHALARRLDSARSDEEFLCCRILFLLSYESSVDFGELCRTCDLADNINKCLARHASRSEIWVDSKLSLLSPEDELALCETLKLLFNVTHKTPSLNTLLTPSVISITTLLRHQNRLSSMILQPPLTLLVNALLNFDLADHGNTAFFPPENPVCHVQILIDILDKVTTKYGPDNLDTAAEPLLTLVRRVFEVAPSDVQQSMQSLLLPGARERAQPLGMADSLSSRLLRLSTSAKTPRIRDSLGTFFFELSNKDPASFVYNVGYGYASGFLASNNIPVPKSESAELTLQPKASDSSPRFSSSTRSREAKSQRSVNFVTGQFLDQEVEDLGPEMSEEDKFREAEKLFVLFERLKKTGVITVQNPLQAAVESGRFQELE